jgi:hypothetical protein
MNALVVILAAILLIIIGINVIATVAVVRSSRYDKHQKWTQVAVIWFIPVLGGVLAWTLARDTKTERTTLDLRDRGGNDDGHIRLDNYSSGQGAGDIGGHD